MTNANHLYKFLFQDSFTLDSEEAIEDIVEGLSQVESLQVNKQPLEKVLKLIGINQAPEPDLRGNITLATEDRLEYERMTILLRTPSNLATLTEAGWIASFADADITAHTAFDQPIYRVHFVEFNEVGGSPAITIKDVPDLNKLLAASAKEAESHMVPGMGANLKIPAISGANLKEDLDALLPAPDIHLGGKKLSDEELEEAKEAVKEASYSDYDQWKEGVRNKYGRAQFDGDKTDCDATDGPDGKKVGTWDGKFGVVYPKNATEKLHTEADQKSDQTLRNDANFIISKLKTEGLWDELIGSHNSTSTLRTWLSPDGAENAVPGTWDLVSNMTKEDLGRLIDFILDHVEAAQR